VHALHAQRSAGTIVHLCSYRYFLLFSACHYHQLEGRPSRAPVPARLGDRGHRLRMHWSGQALDRLEMARFTRRYPQLLDPLLKQMLGMVAVRPPAGAGRVHALRRMTSRQSSGSATHPCKAWGPWRSEACDAPNAGQEGGRAIRPCARRPNDACRAPPGQAAAGPLARRQDFEAKLEAEEESASPPQPEAAPAGSPGLAPPSAGDQDDDEDAEQDDSAGSAAQAKWEVRWRDGQAMAGAPERVVCGSGTGGHAGDASLVIA